MRTRRLPASGPTVVPPRLEGLCATLLLAATGLVGCGDGGATEPPPSGEIAPRISLSLAPGEQVVVADTAQVRSFALRRSDGPREYAVAVHLANATGGTGAADVRLLVKGPDAPAAVASTFPGPALEPSARRSGRSPSARAYARELELRESMRRELLRVGAVPARGSRAPSGSSRAGASLSAATAAAPPEVGEVLRLLWSIQSDFTVSCSDTSMTVDAVVQAVGERFVLLEDLVSRGHFTEADFDGLNAELDDVIYPLNTAYWGTPADIDANERVLVLFTSRVNELTPRNSSTFVGGLFNPIDLSESGRPEGDGFERPFGDCPASNEAELLYVLAPDPDGDFSDPVSVERATRNARKVAAHEFQHLLQAEQRVIKGTGTFDDLEETWLSEGMAHLAEEVAGLGLAGASVRDGLTLSRLVTDEDAREAVLSFHVPNLQSLRRHFLNPGGTQALATQDPSGLGSVAMRGFAWIFLRWLGDHEGPASPEGSLPGSGEEALFRELSTGGPLHASGTANVERAVQTVTGRPTAWSELLGDFVVMAALDDGAVAGSGPAGLPARTQLLTWNLPEVFGDLARGETLPEADGFPEAYPLQRQRLIMSGGTNQAISFSLNASTQRVFVFESMEAHPDMVVQVVSPDGGSVPGSLRPQVTVVRTR